MSRPIRAYVDIEAARHNLQVVRAMAPQSRLMAVVKANGYGHGVERVSRGLTDADAFAVACMEEALELRHAGVLHPILLLEGVFSADELEWVVPRRLELVVHCDEQLRMLEQTPLAAPVRVWIKVDSGMHRLGFDPGQVRSVWSRLQALTWVEKPVRVLSHFASADDQHSALNELQMQRVEQALWSLPGMPLSLANSAAIVNLPQSHHDWVRPGIMLYGVSPLSDISAAELGLKPVMTLVSRVIAVKTVAAGETVGYGGSWRAERVTRLAVVAAGYGDGYPRQISTVTPVLINGRRAPVVGRVSMDMLTVDVTELPAVSVGDPVVLWGKGLAVEEVARHAATIPYTLLCGVTRRVHFLEGVPLLGGQDNCERDKV